MQTVCIGIILAPLLGAGIAGLCALLEQGKKIAALSAIGGVALSFFLSLILLKNLLWDGVELHEGELYTWGIVGGIQFQFGFLIDRLSAAMMVVVSFVSWMVHVYTLGYMKEDPGYSRFFSYTALFTFFMLLLVSANNFLQLFLGWEGVGLVSYLLIGFWYHRESANVASMKAFLVNRVGDLGFLLGIGVILLVFGTLNYQEIFEQATRGDIAGQALQLFQGHHWQAITVICILLFIGAMGKSAQIPLHVWLPDSMEGPTPISALIHAATMVTAGVFMVARMSPLYELSPVASSVVLVVGATTALFMGILGVVQQDIKRIIAYSTLSQLGYMMASQGASAYAAGIFHLFTHAFFKALLFLGAGSVIIALHHEQNIWKMGNLKRYLPITYWTMLVGGLALIGFPGFSGFYSKEIIIDAVRLSSLPGASYAYWALFIGVFFTALYTFRLIFVVFHTHERMDASVRAHLTEPGASVWIPLIMLAIPSLCIAWFVGDALLFDGYFKNSIVVDPLHDALPRIAHHYHSVMHFALQAPMTPLFWVMTLGIFTAWFCYVKRPEIPGLIIRRVEGLHRVLLSKYGFDAFNQIVFAAGGRRLGHVLWQGGDQKIIDGFFVNGSAKSIQILSGVVRQLQSGFLYHYALAMLVGLLVFLLWM
ncbi:MAG: NADH-quinone oxidoreductase subunit L [Gammaproteobacteria bacterium]|nr:NADH-quinone oxidoreductase subunit L [Gammaproteobacteria bacterium]